MTILNRDSLLLFFGDRQYELSIKEIKESRFSLTLQKLMYDFGLSSLIVLDQIHASQGVCVEDLDRATFESWFEYQGDFLVTQKKDCALVVLTADCVPLILYDSRTQTIAAIHSGWKGSACGVVENALAVMQKRYGVNLSDVACFFGPSAKSCCYKVTEEFSNHFKKFDYYQKAFTQKQGNLYFDNGLFLRQELKKFGIRPEKIYTENELCSICSVDLCSFRRDKELAGRQITVVALR